MFVTVKKIGSRMGVILPDVLARELDLTDGTELEISPTADGILVRRPRRRSRRRLGEIVAAIKPASYGRRGQELGQDPPVGKEVW